MIFFLCSEQNSDWNFVWSSNEHYLNKLIQDMVSNDEDMATDDGGARHIWHNVRAYIKVCCKTGY